MTTQKRFEETLALFGEKRNLNVEINGEWANTGTFRVTLPGTFKPLLTARFDWQDDHLSISFNKERPVFPTDFDSVKFQALDELLDRIEEMVFDALPSGHLGANVNA